MKFGADPTVTAKYLDSSNKKYDMTAIQHLMKYNVDCANAILDDSLAKEKEEDLIFDFKVFKHENEGFDLVILEEAEQHSPIEIAKTNDKPLLQSSVPLCSRVCRCVCFHHSL